MCCVIVFFFFKQKTAYELRIIDSSSDLCSSDLGGSRVICRRRRLIVVKKATGLFQGLCYKIVFTFPQHRSEQAVTIDLFVNLNDFPRLAKQLLACKFEPEALLREQDDLPAFEQFTHHIQHRAEMRVIEAHQQIVDHKQL